MLPCEIRWSRQSGQSRRKTYELDETMSFAAIALPLVQIKQVDSFSTWLELEVELKLLSKSLLPITSQRRLRTSTLTILFSDF